LAEWEVRSTDERPVAIPEVAEGRWVAERGRLEVSEAGAPAVVSAATPVRSRNVQEALRGLYLSGAAAAVLALVALRARINGWRTDVAVVEPLEEKPRARGG